jgi:hypothetical protein
MGMLYRTVNMVNDLKKQSIINELLAMGFDGDGAVSIYDLDYYELKRILVMERIRRV